MILRRTAARLSGLGLVMLCVAASLLVGAGPVAADAGMVRAPFGFFAGSLSFRLDAMTPSVVTSAGGNTLTVRGAATNDTEVPLTDLIVRFQRGAALADGRRVEAEIADPGQPVDVIADDWSVFADRIDAGGTRTFALATTISGAGAGSLRIDAPGVYPLMINVNGTRSVDGLPTDVRLGELHVLVTVTSLPGGAGLTASTNGSGTSGSGTSGSGTGPGPAPGTTADPGPAPVPVSLLWPLTSRPHRGVAGVFLDDSLADEVSAGGRLTARLDALASSKIPAGAVTLMIDPMLLDELSAMAGGYRVLLPGRAQTPVTEPPAAVPVAPPPTGPTTAAPTRTTPTPTALISTSPSGSAPAGSAPAGSAPAGSAPVSIRTTDPLPRSGVTTATAAVGHLANRSIASPRPDIPTVPATGTRSGPDTAPAAGSTAAPATAPPPTAPPTTAPPAPTTAPSAPDPNTTAGTRGVAAADFLQRLRKLTQGRQVIVLPYSDPDGIAVTRVGRGAEVRDLHTLGDDVAARTLPDAARITSVAVPPDGIADAATLETYRAAGFAAAVLSRTSATGASSTTGVGRVETAPGSSLPAVVGDRRLEPLLAEVLAPAAGDTGARALNTAVALLGRRHLDGAAASVVQLPGAVIDTAGLDDLGAALAALTGDGFVGPVDLPAAAALAPADSSITARIPETTPVLSSTYLDRLGIARSDLRSLASVLAPQDSGPGAVLVSTLTDALRTLTSTSLRASTTPADAVLATTAGSAEQLRSAVSIRRTVGSYTLASTDSPLVLTLQNTLPFSVRVRIEINGGQAVGLSTEVPPFVDLTANGTEQLRIPATVTRAGSFGISAQLLAADGQPWGPAVPLKIRSNAYGVLTIVLIAVAGGVLLLMVVLRIWQRIRDSRRATAAKAPGDVPGVVPATSSDTTPVTGEPTVPTVPADPADPARGETEQ